MGKIRITKTPPGFAPLAIREQWVNIEIPLATEEDFKENPLSGIRFGSENRNGHIVTAREAVNSLRYNGRLDAANFWAGVTQGGYLEFSKEVCEVI